MKDFILEGLGKISGGEYDNVNIEGVTSCSEKIKAENIHIEGVFTCSGEVEAGSMHCEGVSDFKANVRAKKLTVEGVFNAKDGTKLEADEITCDGVIKSKGEISADIINAEGCISAREIFGDRVKIVTHYPANRIGRFFNHVKSDVTLIEATTIELSGVTAETVNGRDIIIGPYCKIKNLDCSGTLAVDGTSVVSNITGSYTRRD